jgi:hypothetical protein
MCYALGVCPSQKTQPPTRRRTPLKAANFVGSGYFTICLNGCRKPNVSIDAGLGKPRPEHGELFFPPAEWLARRIDFIVYAFKEEDFSPIR